MTTKGRRALEDDRSWQPTELYRICQELASQFPETPVLPYLENVASMPRQVENMYNDLMDQGPARCCASSFVWVRRNRLFWGVGPNGFNISSGTCALPDGGRARERWEAHDLEVERQAAPGQT